MTKQTATLRYLRMAPRKVRLVADVIRGLSVNEAEAQLVMQRKRAAKPLLKLLRSAMANAKNNSKVSLEGLYVEAIKVDGGPMLKRFLPRARGSASPIQKKMSHVTLTLAHGAHIKPARFSIVVPKKKKEATDVKERTKREKAAPEEQDEKTRKQGPGFFKKVFSRKSGMGN